MNRSQCTICGGTVIEVWPVGWTHLDALAILDHDATVAR